MTAALNADVIGASDAIVGRRVHDLIWDQRRTNRSVASALRISDSVLSKKLRGVSGWSLDQVVAAAVTLGVDPRDLMPTAAEVDEWLATNAHRLAGAGDGNRTRTISLDGRGSRGPSRGVKPRRRGPLNWPGYLTVNTHELRACRGQNVTHNRRNLANGMSRAYRPLRSTGRGITCTTRRSTNGRRG